MRNLILDFLSLKESSDAEKTVATISSGVSLRGYNLWMLLCSAMLASIGLDTNSAAIIIGAMLISPLMSPILGVGLSVAIHDRKLLLRSTRNLAVAVVISLLVSIIYFTLTPLGEATSEEQGRTFPTLLDVMVALFGGIAGIISISRHESTNAIPGVAIATALMPPLCTSGFGIATGQWNYFFGAFYLFFINAVFISLSTYLIVKYLGFHTITMVDKRLEKKYSYWFTAISIIVLLPSIYFLYTVYRKESIRRDIDELVIAPIRNKGEEIIKWDVQEKDTASLINIYYSGPALPDSLTHAIDSSLQQHKLSFYRIKPLRMNLSKEEISQLSADMSRQMFLEMHLDEIKNEQKTADTAINTLPFTQYYSEAKIAFPFIDTLYNGWMMKPGMRGSIDTLPVVFYKSRKRPSRAQEQQMYQYFKLRMAADTVALINQ